MEPARSIPVYRNSSYLLFHGHQHASPPFNPRMAAPMKIALVLPVVLFAFLALSWFSRRRRGGPHPSYPAEFLHAVEEHFRNQGRVVVMGPEGAMIDEDGGVLGLENLAQSWKSALPGERPGILATHFEAIDESRRQAQARDAMLTDYAVASGFIATRLLDEDYVRTVGAEHLVLRSDIEGLFTVASFDFPESVRTFPPDRLREWGVSPDEVFQLGIDNVVDRYPLQKEFQERLPGCPLHLFATESLFAATHLLRPEAFAEALGPHGAFVLAPTRNAILVHPIESSDSLRVLPTLIGLAHQLHQQGPGSLTTSIYLLQDGVLRRIRTSVENRKVQVIDPPVEFIDLVAALSPAEPQP